MAGQPGSLGASAPPERRRERRAEAARRRAVARRRLAVLAAAGVGAFTLGAVAGSGGGPDDGIEQASAGDGTELPRGGRSLLPRYRLVGFYGSPADEALGTLGVGTPAEALQRLVEQARAYRGNRPVMPVAELIATTATADPGEDDLHRSHQPDSVVREYLAEARRRNALLLLDVQPGRADFIGEVERLERYLREPDVGLALDPEWHVGPDEAPGDVIGSVDVATVNEVSAYLADVVREHGLPEKLFVVHQFTAGMIEGAGAPRDRPGIATVLNVDGFGDPASKIDKYRQLRPESGSPLGAGFKLFYNEDEIVMEPNDVLNLSPKPDLVVYE